MESNNNSDHSKNFNKTNPNKNFNLSKFSSVQKSQTNDLKLDDRNSTVFDCYNRSPFPTIDDIMDKEYPHLLKIFHLLYPRSSFNNVSVVGNHHQSDEEHRDLKTTLYNLIIRQLLADGYASIAMLLQQNLSKDIQTNVSVQALNQSSSDKLQMMFNIMFYIEKRSQVDKNFSRFLNWFLSFSSETNSKEFDCSSVNSSVQSLASSSNSNLNNSSFFYENNSDSNPTFELDEPSNGLVSELKMEYKIGSSGTESILLDKPHGFCIGMNNDIVIADTNNHRICVFDINGQFKLTFGECGIKAGQLFQPRKIAMLPPQILEADGEPPVFIVCDRGSFRSRMQIFTLTGEFVRLIEIPFMDIVAGLTTTIDGFIIMVDSVRPGVITLNAKGEILNWFSCSSYMMEPSDIVIHNRKFFICDFKGHCVAVIDEEGNLVRKLSAKLLKFPNGIDVSNEGDIICCDSHGNRFHIAVFSENGELLQDYECPYIKVSRCCGVKLTSNGLIVTLAKNNHHAVVFKQAMI